MADDGIEEISREHWDAFAPIGDEIRAGVRPSAWFADEKRRLLGMVAEDIADGDWCFFVHGRQDGFCRAVALGLSLTSADEAERSMVSKMMGLLSTEQFEPMEEA